MIFYEHPLNEKVRLFLRLEQLLQRADYHLKSDTRTDTHAAFLTLLDLINLSARMDIKSEVLKELDRQSMSLQNMSSRRVANSDIQPSVSLDDDTLQNILQAQGLLIERLHTIHGHFGQHLKTHHFINSLRQRAGLPGGINSFDVPLYQYWLSRPASKRIEDMRDWMIPFEVIKDAVDLILNLVRQSETKRKIVARNGFYQQSLDFRHNYQLMRIEMPEQVGYYPEVSAGKQRFSIRFVMGHNMEERSKQYSKDVECHLTLCSF